MATKPAKPAAAEAEAPAAKPKGKKMVLAAIGLVVLAAAGGGGWYFLKGSHHEEPKAVVVEPTFMVLEPFTVNLQREEGDQFLQIGITFKVSSPDMAEKARQRLPEIRSRLLFLLSAKRASELMPLEGKQKLARDILSETNAILGQRGAAAGGAEAASGAETATGAESASGGTGITDVLFTSFIIQ